MFSNNIVNVFALIFTGFAILVGIASLVSISVLLKHAEKRSIASEVALIYAALFLFLLLGAFSSAQIF